jgi:hypothetical protein
VLLLHTTCIADESSLFGFPLPGGMALCLWLLRVYQCRESSPFRQAQVTTFGAPLVLFNANFKPGKIFFFLVVPPFSFVADTHFALGSSGADAPPIAQYCEADEKWDVVSVINNRDVVPRLLGHDMDIVSRLFGSHYAMPAASNRDHIAARLGRHIGHFHHVGKCIALVTNAPNLMGPEVPQQLAVADGRHARRVPAPVVVDYLTYHPSSVLVGIKDHLGHVYERSCAGSLQTVLDSTP